LRDAAAAIAATAHQALPPDRRYAQYLVVLVERTGARFSVSRDLRFQFAARDLPAAATKSFSSPIDGEASLGAGELIENAPLATRDDLDKAQDFLSHLPSGCVVTRMGAARSSAVVSSEGDITVAARCADGFRVYNIHHGRIDRLN